ncbi:MAG: hypothetical protein KKF50_00335 [Nanoarchaeota archaeon]|nr:hypothetical protein [Nanoarchaeota archaeon]
MKKGVVGMFVLCFLFVNLISVSVFAAVSDEEISIFYKADIDVDLLETYNVGDVIDEVITIYNREDFPIVDGFLVIEVLKGCEAPTYPSQFSDCDNIFGEVVIGGINVPANSNVDVPFSYALREDLGSGTYRMDFAFRTKKTPIIGMPHILVSSKYQTFEVTGAGSFPYANIVRTKTSINNQTGPIGVGINPGEDFTLDVYVDSEKAQGATLEVSICDWQDSICDLISSKTKSVSLVAGEQLILVGLKVPDSPDAYAIRIELIDFDGLVSLYRSRVVSQGAMAKVRQLSTDNYYYNDEEMTVSILVGGSPDHYTFPVTEDIFLTVTVTDLVGDKVVGTKTQIIGNMDVNNFFEEIDFKLAVAGKLYKFETCAKLINSKTNELYEEYCYVTDANNFPSSIHDVKLEESSMGEKFEGTVCVYDGITDEPLESELFISVKQGTLIVVQKRQVVDNCLDLVFDVGNGKKYDILVQDMGTNQDFNFEVNSDMILFGVSRDIWLYVILAGIIIVVVTIVIIVVAAKNRRKLKQYG